MSVTTFPGQARAAYSLTGQFSFDAMTAGATAEENGLVSFIIEGFDGMTSLGTFSGAVQNLILTPLLSSFLLADFPPALRVRNGTGMTISR